MIKDNMRVVLDIHFDGKNIDDIFNLPCISGITKDKNNKPVASLYRESTEGRTTLSLGDHICQYASGKWQVYGSDAAESVNHIGKYRYE